MGNFVTEEDHDFTARLWRWAGRQSVRLDDRPPFTSSGMTRPRYDLELLLDVAIEEFTKRGYDGTSIEHLSAATGLSKSSLYHHVEGKEHILRLGLERAVTPLLGLLDEPESREGKAIDRLTYVLRRQIAILADQLAAVSLLLRVRGNTETERWALEQRRRSTPSSPISYALGWRKVTCALISTPRSSPACSRAPSTRSPSGTGPATAHSAPKPSPTPCSRPVSPASAPSCASTSPHEVSIRRRPSGYSTSERRDFLAVDVPKPVRQSARRPGALDLSHPQG